MNQKTRQATVKNAVHDDMPGVAFAEQIPAALDALENRVLDPVSFAIFCVLLSKAATAKNLTHLDNREIGRQAGVTRQSVISASMRRLVSARFLAVDFKADGSVEAYRIAR